MGGDLDRREMRALLESEGGWGRVGSADQRNRYAKRKPDMRRGPRSCRCGNRETHLGMANGVALMGGCELCVARWVRNPRGR